MEVDDKYFLIAFWALVSQNFPIATTISTSYNFKILTKMGSQILYKGSISDTC